jgi:hypothetical protein
MNSHLDVDRSITAWLVAEAPDRAPQRLLDVSREQLRTTRQRRAWWPAWRIPMNAYAKLALATAVVVVVAVLGISFLPRDGGFAGPSPVESDSPSPQPSPTLLTRAGTGSLAAGRYVTDSTDTAFPVAAAFTLPDGWNNDGWAVTKDDVAVSFWTVAETYGDPCQWESTKVNLGPTVDDLVAALRAQKDRNATEPVPTTLGGFEGQLIEVDWPDDVLQTNCDPGAGNSVGEYRLFIAPGPGDPSRWGSMGTHSVLRIADVNGTRVLVEITEPPGITDAQRAEAEQIVDSIEFE